MNAVRRLGVAALAAAVVMAITPLASPASAATAPAFGVSFHAMWDYDSDAHRVEILNKLADGGVGWVRLDISWCSLEHDGPGVFEPSYVRRLDALVAAAEARGVKVLGQIYCTPGWANGHEDDPWWVASPLPPSDPASLASVMTWLATRYKGRVGAWEIWNEPNHPNFFTQEPADYVPLLKAAYPAVKAADPAAVVVTGGTSYTDYEWVRDMYALGAKGSFDALAIHPYLAPADKGPEYDNNTMWTITATPKVRDIMVANGDADKPIWFTEFGWSSHSNLYASCYDVFRNYKDPDPNDGIGCSSNGSMGVTAEQQGDFLVRTLKFVGANYPYVTNVFWYNATNKDSDNVHEANFGLLNRDSTPKPAYDAMKSFLTASAEPAPVQTPDASSTPDPSPSPSASPTATPAPAPSTSPSPTPTQSPAPSPTPATETLANGSFENGTIGWSAVGARLDSVAGGPSGARSGRVRKTTALKLRSELVPSGGSVTATGWIRPGAAGQTVKVTVVELSGTQEVDRRAATFKVSSTAWQRLPKVTYRSLRATTSVQLRVDVSGGSVFYVDGMSLLRT